MQIRKVLLSCAALFSLASCGGSSSSTAPTIPSQDDSQVIAPVVEDISCSVNYPLTISSIVTENDNTNIAMLFNGVKLNASNWQAPSLNTNIIIELANPALIQALVITWSNLEYVHLFKVYSSKDKETWQLVDTPSQSSENSLIPDLIDLTASGASTALYIKLELSGNEVSEPSNILELEVFGCEQDITHNIELIDWYLSVPTDEDNDDKSDSIKEDDLADGYFDARFFALSQDGGLTFSTSVSGYKTSTNTKYVRSELREMLRRGNTSYKTQGVNKNNWVFSTAPQTDLNNAGGIDGELTAELAVNHVTSTGESYQIGRVIIGQIHANDDEPARLYYRKLPGNENGAIYLAHEILGGDDIYYEIIGSRSNSASNPADGIPLNEKFTYAIIVNGHNLAITIIKSDGSEFTKNIDMTNSGYDEGDQYMYFKAGVYNQNNSGDQHDYVQATFYQIHNSHTGYAH